MLHTGLFLHAIPETMLLRLQKIMNWFHLPGEFCRNRHVLMWRSMDCYLLSDLECETSVLWCGNKIFRSSYNPPLLVLTGSEEPPEHIQFLLPTYHFSNQEFQCKVTAPLSTHLHVSLPPLPCNPTLSSSDSKNRPKCYHRAWLVGFLDPLIGGRSPGTHYSGCSTHLPLLFLTFFKIRLKLETKNRKSDERISLSSSYSCR